MLFHLIIDSILHFDVYLSRIDEKIPEAKLSNSLWTGSEKQQSLQNKYTRKSVLV